MLSTDSGVHERLLMEIKGVRCSFAFESEGLPDQSRTRCYGDFSVRLGRTRRDIGCLVQVARRDCSTTWSRTGGPINVAKTGSRDCPELILR